MSVNFHLEINADYIENECFFCGKKLVPVLGFIYWRGMSGEIALHKHCAATLSAHLGSDLIKLKKKRSKLEIDSQIDIY